MNFEEFEEYVRKLEMQIDKQEAHVKILYKEQLVSMNKYKDANDKLNALIDLLKAATTILYSGGLDNE